MSSAKELKVTITSDPSGAQVQINGHNEGATPLTLTELPVSGDKSVKLNRNFFTGETQEADYAKHLSDPLKITVSRSGCISQTLSITSGPYPRWNNHGSADYYYYLLTADTFKVTLVCWDAYFQKGNEFFGAQKFPEAISEYEQVLKVNPDDFAALLNTGSADFRMGKFSAAQEFAQKAIRIKADAPEAWYLQGVASAHLGDHAGAITSLRKAALLKPDYATYLALAQELMVTNDRVDAASAIDQAISLDSTKPDAYIHAIELNPKDAHAHLNLGMAYFHTGEREKALAEYNSLLSLDPSLAQQLGKLLGVGQ